MKKFD
jgi:hypothetical protein